MTRRARQVVIQQPYTIDIRSVSLPAPGPGEVLVKTWGSAISGGTELLFYRGQAPTDMAVDATLPGLTNELSYPLHYGYSCVGTVVETGPGVDPSRIGQRVFAFHPHAECFIAAYDALQPIPDPIHWEQALFLPNMETAVNLVMDAQPLLGEEVVIFGQGVVGLLVLFLLRRFPLASLTVVDALDQRLDLARAWGADAAYSPQAWEQTANKNVDLMIEVSSNPAALAAALRHAPYGARIVVGSWYGTKSATLDLGGSFHRNRITIQSSQVSTIGAAWQARWDKARRFAVAWRYLADLPVDELITHRLPVADAAQAFRQLDQAADQTLQVILTYP